MRSDRRYLRNLGHRHDLMALGPVREAKARGLRVPGDVSVVGTTTRRAGLHRAAVDHDAPNAGAMSRHAVAALLDEGRGSPHPRREVLFATELVVRRSTGPGPADAAAGG